MDKPRTWHAQSIMSYAAANAKVKAMAAKAIQMEMSLDAGQPASLGYPATGNLEDTELSIEEKQRLLNDAVTSICRYIQDKPLRDYINAIAATDKDINFYLAQWKRAAKLGTQNKTALKHILGTEIDITNIIWMYRLKKYHRIKGSATYGYLIPIRHRLSNDATRHMAEAATIKALLEVVAQSPYGMAVQFTRVQSDWHGQNTQPSYKRLSPEGQLVNAISKHYQAAARRYPNSIAPVVAYLHRLKI